MGVLTQLMKQWTPLTRMRRVILSNGSPSRPLADFAWYIFWIVSSKEDKDTTSHYLEESKSVVYSLIVAFTISTLRFQSWWDWRMAFVFFEKILTKVVHAVKYFEILGNFPKSYGWPGRLSSNGVGANPKTWWNHEGRGALTSTWNKTKNIDERSIFFRLSLVDEKWKNIYSRMENGREKY